MSAVYRPMTELEEKRVVALGRCTLPHASMTKRFARQLSDQLAKKQITDKQASYLAVCCYRFRRQMPASVVPDSIPHGYMTPKMREDAARLERVKKEYAEVMAASDRSQLL